jgi:hypothetical protein
MKPAQLARHAALRGAFYFAALTSVATAQNQTWIRQVGSSGVDYAYAAAPDGSGGVFVSGDTGGSLGGPSAGGTDAWLARYDGAGTQTWIRQFGTDQYDSASAAASDGLGGVYVSGVTQGSLGGPHAGSYDAWLAHYDGAGNRTWIRQFGVSLDDQAFAVAPDETGGVFVSGYTQGSLGGSSAGNWDVWLARYDNAGNQSWIRQFGTTYQDEVYAAASDGSGGVYVSGATDGSLGGPNVNDDDAWLARYDGAGNQTWIRQLGSSGSDYARAAAPDGVGGVYVSGDTSGSLGGPSAGGYVDAWLARYDNAGNQTWIRQFGLSTYDGAFAAAPDGSGGVYVSGGTYGSLGGPHAGYRDAWLAYYGDAGNRIWIQQFGTSGEDYVYAAALDGVGGVYLGGSTSGTFGGPFAGSGDAWLAHYSDSLFTVRYCTPAVPNSTGQSGVLTAIGRNAIQANDVTLIANSLSLNSFGFFLTSRDQGSVFPVSNSQGRLCLGGFIGRYVGPGQVKNSGSMGTFTLVLDLNAMAHPFSPVTAQPGQTWHFQAWHRDANPLLTSNFTDAVSVTFH